MVFLIQPLAHMGEVLANPFSYASMSIASPRYYKAEIYHTANIPIKVIAFPHRSNVEFTKILYSLDGGLNKTLSISTISSSSGYFGKGSIDNLTDGFHLFDVYSFDSKGNVIHSNTTFQVDIKAYNERLIINSGIVVSIFAILAVAIIIIYRRRNTSKGLESKRLES